MIHLFVFTIAIFGVAFVIGFSKVSLPLRKAISVSKVTGPWTLARQWSLDLIECVACTSFHAGWISVALGLAPHVFGGGVLGAVFAAFYCCASSLLLAKFAGLDD